MKRFLFKLFKYGALFILLVNCIGWIGDKALRDSNFFKPSFLLNNFSVDDTLNYIILGSSRGLTTLNSKQIDEELGLSGANLSMDDTDLKSHLLMLKHFFNNGYKSDYTVLALDYSSFYTTQSRLGDNDYRFSPFIQKKYIEAHFDSYETLSLKPNTNSFFFPFLKYSYYNLQIVPAASYSLLFPSKRHRFDNKGNYTYPNANKANLKELVPAIKTVEIINPLINEIREICNKNGSELLIYVAPYQNIDIVLKDSANVINHSGITTSTELFYDQIHVNTKGRAFATKSFIQEFSNYTGLK